MTTNTSNTANTVSAGANALTQGLVQIGLQLAINWAVGEFQEWDRREDVYRVWGATDGKLKVIDAGYDFNKSVAAVARHYAVVAQLCIEQKQRSLAIRLTNAERIDYLKNKYTVLQDTVAKLKSAVQPLINTLREHIAAEDVYQARQTERLSLLDEIQLFMDAARATYYKKEVLYDNAIAENAVDPAYKAFFNSFYDAMMFAMGYRRYLDGIYASIRDDYTARKSQIIQEIYASKDPERMATIDTLDIDYVANVKYKEFNRISPGAYNDVFRLQMFTGTLQEFLERSNYLFSKLVSDDGFVFWTDLYEKVSSVAEYLGQRVDITKAITLVGALQGDDMLTKAKRFAELEKDTVLDELLPTDVRELVSGDLFDIPVNALTLENYVSELSEYKKWMLTETGIWTDMSRSEYAIGDGSSVITAVNLYEQLMNSWWDRMNGFIEVYVNEANRRIQRIGSDAVLSVAVGTAPQLLKIPGVTLSATVPGEFPTPVSSGSGGGVVGAALLALALLNF